MAPVGPTTAATAVLAVLAGVCTQSGYIPGELVLQRRLELDALLPDASAKEEAERECAEQHRVAAEKEALENAALKRAAQEQEEAAKRAALEKAAVEKAQAAEREAREKRAAKARKAAAAEKAAAEKAAAEQAAAEKAAAEQAVTERAVAEKAAADKVAAEKEAAEKAEAARLAEQEAAEKAAQARRDLNLAMAVNSFGKTVEVLTSTAEAKAAIGSSSTMTTAQVFSAAAVVDVLLCLVLLRWRAMRQSSSAEALQVVRPASPASAEPEVPAVQLAEAPDASVQTVDCQTAPAQPEEVRERWADMAGDEAPSQQAAAPAASLEPLFSPVKAGGPAFRPIAASPPEAYYIGEDDCEEEACGSLPRRPSASPSHHADPSPQQAFARKLFFHLPSVGGSLPRRRLFEDGEMAAERPGRSSAASPSPARKSPARSPARSRQTPSKAAQPKKVWTPKRTPTASPSRPAATEATSVAAVPEEIVVPAAVPLPQSPTAVPKETIDVTSWADELSKEQEESVTVAVPTASGKKIHINIKPGSPASGARGKATDWLGGASPIVSEKKGSPASFAYQ